MKSNLTTLAKAQGLMPCTGQPGMGADMVLTLLFWRMASDLWQRASAGQGKTCDAVLAAMKEPSQLIMDGECLFESCRTADPADTGKAIQAGLTRLAALQTHGALNAVMRPERFIFLAGFFKQNRNAQALAEIVDLIDSMTFADNHPSLACGNRFLAFITSLNPQHHRPVRNAATLMARLLQPQPGEIVFDPACGHGHALMECAHALAQHFPAAAPHLHGMEADPNQWALAKMVLLLSGVRQARLGNVAALAQSVRMQEKQGFSPADIVLTIVPDMTQPWQPALAAREQDRRFPLGPPQDSRLALVWHGLASLKPGSGRMAVLISRSALASDEGLVFAHYLVERNLLDAVIELPGYGPLPLLLIARQQKPDTAIAFIFHRQTESVYQTSHIAGAYEAHQQRCRHPYLMRIDNSVLASHPSPFDWQQFAAMATRAEMA